jgi:hypothetical protein
MKELGKGELKLVESFIEPYRDILEDVLTSMDIHSVAEQQAWKDWAVDEIMFKLDFDRNKAINIIDKLESYYKTKIIHEDD